MKRIVLVAALLGVLSVAMAPALASANNSQPSTSAAIAAPGEQGVVTPVRWWGPRPYYGWYRGYWGPRYYYPGPVYRYGYYYPWWRGYYGPGAYYYGPGTSFYFAF